MTRGQAVCVIALLAALLIVQIIIAHYAAEIIHTLRLLDVACP